MKRLFGALLVCVILIMLTFSTTVSATAVTLTARVGSAGDNCTVYYDGSEWKFTNTGVIAVGYYSPEFYKMGAGFRFTNITIPNGSLITQAYLTFTAYDTYNTATVVNSVIQGESGAHPQPFSSYVDYVNRNRLTQTVLWQNITPWLPGTAYQSPSISSIIQGIISQSVWTSGSDLVLFWGDLLNQSTNTSFVTRRAYSYAHNSALAVALTVVYEPSYNPYSSVDLTALEKGVKDLQSSSTVVQSNVDGISKQLIALNSQIGVVSSQSTALTNQVGGITTQNTALTTQVSEVRAQYTELAKQVASTDARIVALNTQLSALVSQVTGVSTTAEGVQSSVRTMQTTVSSVKAVAEEMSTNLKALKVESSTLLSDVVKLEEDNTKLTSKVSRLETWLFVILAIQVISLIILFGLIRRGDGSLRLLRDATRI